MAASDNQPLCVGVCLTDPDSGYCLGCGRPPLPTVTAQQGIVSEEFRALRLPAEEPDDDRPGAR